MKKLLLAVFMFFTATIIAQETGTIEGTLTDNDANGTPLPFANVIIKGTSKGATTDFDGNYTIQNVPVGTYDVEFSFVGYEAVTVSDVVVEANKFTNVSTGLGASAAALDEVVISVQTSREREQALLLEQKKAIEIRESIGAQQLSKQGVTDAATATSKISGVTTSEASGDVFIRGLGDRYLYTTFNGLPIPSDDVERKNIDLGLFSTRIIESVGISKTYSAQSYADQASGNVDISSKVLSGSSDFSVRVRGGVNTNAYQDGVRDNFKVTANKSDYQLGFLNNQGFTKATLPSGATRLVNYETYPRLTQQTWNTGTASSPVNYRYAISAGKKIGEKLKIFGAGSQSAGYTYRQGLFRQYRSNSLDDQFTDATYYNYTINTTGLLNAEYDIDDNNELRYVTLFINKLEDNVFEGGRNGEGIIFEETDTNEGNQFVRDQNTRQTRLWVNQLFGDHQLNEKNNLTWGLGYNMVAADEPNRIRNEFNFINSDGRIQLGRTGGFQQRKSFQFIDDSEIAGYVKNEITFVDTDDKNTSLTVGLNYRRKQRDFKSQFLGVEEVRTDAINPESIDNLNPVFTVNNFEDEILDLNIIPTDLYEGELNSKSAFATFNYGKEKLNINVGARFQIDELNVDYDVNNIVGRIGNSNQEYENLFLIANLKYNLSEEQSLRFATSRTITLPEFKEIAPFEYVSPTGQVTRGNPNIKASTNYNFDLKYEFFPTNDQLLSLTGFYKIIEDPINKVQDRGAAGVFSYFNAGDQADVFGLEFESRINIIKAEDDEGSNLRLIVNATRMWHEQDLKEVFDDQGRFVQTFRYKGLTEEGLQGASDWIFNGNLNFTTEGDNPFDATLSANYASDKIFALGAPEIQTESADQYNDAIVEKGFVTLDAIISKTFAERFNVRLTARNLLNPLIERTQNIKPGGLATESPEIEQTVRSYDLGRTFLLGLTYEL